MDSEIDGEAAFGTRFSREHQVAIEDRIMARDQRSRHLASELEGRGDSGVVRGSRGWRYKLSWDDGSCDGESGKRSKEAITGLRMSMSLVPWALQKRML